MSKLNNRNWTLLFRRGTYATLVSSTTYFTQGEPAYTTDSKQLYITDGSNNKIPVMGNTWLTTALTALSTLTTTGERAFVTDATTASATFLSTPVGGGAVFCPVFFSANGKWTVG
jgi:hypothetical protein